MRFATVVMFFIGGAAVGYWAGRHDSSDKVSFVSKNDESQIENRRLKGLLASAPQSLPSAVEASTNGPARPPVFTPLEKLKMLADLQERNLIKLALTFLDRKGKLDDSFVNLFVLTSQEQGRLQKGIDDVRPGLMPQLGDNRAALMSFLEESANSGFHFFFLSN